MLPSPTVFASARSRPGRAVLGAVIVALGTLPALAPGAASSPSLRDLEARMDEIQDKLDTTTERIEALRTEADRTRLRIALIQERRDELRTRIERLQERAAERANELYRDGGVGLLEVLFAAGDLSDLTDRAEMLARVSLQSDSVFTSLSRSRLELGALGRELERREDRLVETTNELRATSRRLQRQFDEVSKEYKELESRLARAAAAARSAEGASTSGAAAEQVSPAAGGMACPVAGAVSFVDSWGAPRAGHPHQGVDMMGAYGTPLVAIVSGTVTYSGYDGSGGNMIFLSGDDGNQYWYLHNQSNTVTGGHVAVGQQIATLGDTGNAEGTPHLHFEFHPGGGAATNPYPLVASIC